MITGFRHKGLRRLYETGSKSGVKILHAEKLRLILALLDAAKNPEGLNAPALRLHKLKGDMDGFWSVTISGNWRVIFRFKGEDACDVDYVDYH